MSSDEAERDLTPEEEAEVSRVLFGLSGPLPMPPDVVARLEETLADLQAGAGETRAATAPAPAPLAAPPAPRVPAPRPARTPPPGRARWPRVVLAAAAVVVGGYSVASLVSSGVMTESDTAGSTDSAALEDSGAGGGAESAPESGAEELAQRLPTPVPEVNLEPQGLAADVRRELPRLKAAAQGSVDDAGRCTTPPLDRRDEWFLVHFKGEEASLVLHRRSERRLEAQVFSCGSAAELARADLRPLE